MAPSSVRLLDDDEIVLKKTGVRFPLELRPNGFRSDDMTTWPDIDGRLELVDGRLLYMPPCADIQQDVAVDAVYVLRSWSAAHQGFVVGGNEAGMKLGSDVRAADAAVWSTTVAGPSTGRLRQSPPILAVEVAGQDEDEDVLRSKAQWYLQHGVQVVWLILPSTREVIVIGHASELRCSAVQRLVEHPSLPGLKPKVSEFFAQLER